MPHFFLCSFVLTQKNPKVSRKVDRRLDTKEEEGKTNIYTFLGYIQKRMEDEPEVELIQLWKEVTDKGCNGSRATFYHHLKNYVKPIERSRQPKLHDVSWLPYRSRLAEYKMYM